MSNPVKHISRAQLQVLLAQVKGAKPLTISAFVDAHPRKTGNPYAEIRKLSKVNGFTGCDYSASVNRQRDREGSVPAFEAKERSWGERVSPALVELKGKWYLAIQPQATATPLYFARSEGKPFVHVPKAKIETFLPAERPATNQGTEKEVVYRNYSLENIVGLTMDGQSYRVRD